MNETDLNTQAELDLPAKAGRDAKRHALPAGKSRLKRGDSCTRSVTETPLREISTIAKKDPGALFWECSYVPVSLVAKDWKITPRRIRSLLTEGRLTGRRLENGYWEVAYPYRYIIGTRGPVLKRQQPPKRGRPKSVGMTE